MDLEQWFAQFDERMNKAVPQIVVETANEYFKDRFNKQEWDGKPWAPLNPKYAAKKKRGAGRILTARGELQQSVRPSKVSQERVVISAGNSKAPYAKIHNEGGRVRGMRYVRGYHAKNFMGKGKRVQIRPHTRKVDFFMPRRQFIGHSPFLNRLIIDRLKKAFNK